MWTHILRGVGTMYGTIERMYDSILYLSTRRTRVIVLKSF